MSNLSNKFDNWKEIEIDGEKRILLRPNINASYYLGFVLKGIQNTQEVNAIYFGYSDGNHLFYDLNPKGEVDVYVSKGRCFMSYLSHGEDDPFIPFVYADYLGTLPSCREKEFIFKQIQKIKKQETELTNKQIQKIMANTN